MFNFFGVCVKITLVTLVYFVTGYGPRHSIISRRITQAMDHPRCNRPTPLLLNARNYYSWSQKTKMILIREKMWNVVKDTPPAIKSQKWIEHNEQALACIGLLVEDKYLVDIREHTEAHSAWAHLSDLYGQRNMQTRMLLHKTLFTSKYQNGSDISEHLVEMMNIASRLRDLGHPLDEPLLCSAILCSLPTEFATLITTIESGSDQSLSVDNVRARITEEANRHRLLKENKPKPTIALLTNTEPMARGNAPSMECYYCHRRGHLKRDCRMRKAHESHEGLSDPKKQYSYRRTLPSSTQQDDDQADDASIPRAYHIVATQPRIMTVGMKSTTKIQQEWIIDTGASEHICGDLNMIQNLNTPEQLPIFQTADGKDNMAKGVGNSTVSIRGENNQVHQLSLSPVYYLPQVTDNLISIKRLDQQGYLTTFKNGKAVIKLDTKTWVLGQINQGLYKTISSPEAKVHLCSHTLHDRMGHPNQHDLRKTLEHSSEISHIDNINQEGDKCKPCLQAKLSNAPFQTKEEPNSTKRFEMLHSDICGPIRPATLGGNSYILTITDDHTRYCVTRLLKHKNEAPLHIRSFIEEHITRLGRPPARIRTDGGGEFCNKELQNYFRIKGIQHQITVPHTPQENGTSERRNRTLLDSTRAVLKSSKLPRQMWGEVVKTTNYLQNLTIRKDQEKTPFEKWTGKSPTYRHLHPIGTTCIYLNTSPTKSKLDDRGIEGVLVGYGPSTHIYRIWNPRRNTLQLHRRVVFLDKPCTICTIPKHDLRIASSGASSPEPEDTNDITPQEDHLIRKSPRETSGRAPKKLTYDQQHNQLNQEQDWFMHNQGKV